MPSILLQNLPGLTCLLSAHRASRWLAARRNRPDSKLQMRFAALITDRADCWFLTRGVGDGHGRRPFSSCSLPFPQRSLPLRCPFSARTMTSPAHASRPSPGSHDSLSLSRAATLTSSSTPPQTTDGPAMVGDNEKRSSPSDPVVISFETAGIEKLNPRVRSISLPVFKKRTELTDLGLQGWSHRKR